MASTYCLSGAGLTLVNAVVTLAWVNPAAAPKPDIILRRLWVGQSNNMASAQQRVQINSQIATFPTLTAATPALLSNVSGASVITGGAAGAAGTCGINATVEGGTKTVLWQDTFNVVNGWLLVLTPDEYIEMTAGSASGLGLHLPVAATTLTNWNCGMTWVED